MVNESSVNRTSASSEHARHHRHYETGKWRENDTYLSDEEYARALDTIVKGCADVLITDSSGEGKILIGYRNVEPAKDSAWFIGGRIRVGDSAIRAARRNVLRECKIDIEEERFKFVCTSTHVWSRRKQRPEENGTGDVIVVTTVAITEEEKNKIVMTNTEYHGFAWVSPEEILTNDEFHEALKDAVKAMFFNQKQLELIKACQTNEASDEKIAKLARDLFSSSFSSSH